MKTSRGLNSATVGAPSTHPLRQARRARSKPPRILLGFNMAACWDRSVLRGVLDVSNEHGWDLLQAVPNPGIMEIARDWSPAMIVVDRYLQCIEQGHILGTPVVAVNVDLTPQLVPSVCCNHTAMGRLAAQHLASTGLRSMACFTYSRLAFSTARVEGFRQFLVDHGLKYHAGGEFSDDPDDAAYCSHDAIIAWLERLPKPCGVFACCDQWARQVAHYCRRLDLRIPEDVALVGADNDTIACELGSPPLSSVVLPWRRMGEIVGGIIRDHLRGKTVARERIDVDPIGIMARRSSDVMSIDDPEIAEVIRWIRKNADHPVSVSDVLRAFPIYRQRLERLFKQKLGRTVMQEIRQAHLALAQQLLASTSLPISEVAVRSGFTSATMLGIAFQHECGITPSAYRRGFDQDAENTTRDV